MSAHEQYDRVNEVEGSSDRNFGFVFTGFFLLVGLSPLRHHLPPRIWAFIVSGVLLLISLIVPKILSPANFLWTKLALLLHRIMSPVAMGAVFFLVATPIAAIMKMLGRDPLRLAYDRNAKSYWIGRPASQPAPRSMENQF